MESEEIEQIKKELDNAKAKHPHFIDAFDLSPRTEERLEYYRRELKDAEKWKRVTFKDVLMCEFCEVLDAYCNGERAHAIQELAQCACVCIRAMEYLKGLNVPRGTFNEKKGS